MLVCTPGGSALKDLFNFPLTISNSTPGTALATGHIWIQTSFAPQHVIVDEAIRLSYLGLPSTNNCLFLIVASNNQGGLTIESQKKLSDTSKMSFIWHREPSITGSSWPLTNNNTFAPHTLIDSLQNIPRAYSKNSSGVVNAENAYIWDGTVWQMISQQGKYLAAAAISNSSAASSNLFNVSGTSLNAHTVPSDMTYVESLSLSKDGQYFGIARNTSPTPLSINSRSGDSFSEVSIDYTGSAATENALDVSFSATSAYMGAVLQSTTNSSFYGAVLFQRQGDGSFKYFAQYASMTTSLNISKVSPDGNYLAVIFGSGSSTTLYIMKISSGGIAQVYTVSFGSNGTYSACWSEDSSTLSLLMSGSKVAFIYLTGVDTFSSSGLITTSLTTFKNPISTGPQYAFFAVSNSGEIGYMDMINRATGITTLRSGKAYSSATISNDGAIGFASNTTDNTIDSFTVSGTTWTYVSSTAVTSGSAAVMAML